MTMFFTGFVELPSILSASRLSGSGPLGSSPGRTRMCWMSTSDAWILSPAPRIMMPGEGAVWPAIVMKLLRKVRSDVRRMTPDTSNTQVRGVVPSTQAFNDPAVRIQIGHLVDGAATAGGSLHTVTRCARNDRKCLCLGGG